MGTIHRLTIRPRPVTAERVSFGEERNGQRTFDAQAPEESPLATVHALRPLHAQDEALRLYERASVLDEDQSGWEDAAKLYRRALQLDPELDIAYTNLANILYRQSRASYTAAARRVREKEAKALYHKALELNPAQSEANYNLGYIALCDGQPGASIGLFEKALNSDPAFADAHFNMGLAFEEMGWPERAKRQWERYLELEPCGEWAEEAKAHLRR